MNHQTHYWALRQQARYLFVPSVGNRRYGLVVASLWWWGVVFDLWIVVASISHMEGAGSSGLVFFVCVDNAIFRFFREFFNCFVL